MITKTINIPTGAVAELIEVFGADYQDNEGQTKAQFASAQFDKELVAYIKNRVRNHRKQVALEALNRDYDLTIE